MQMSECEDVESEEETDISSWIVNVTCDDELNSFSNGGDVVENNNDEEIEMDNKLHCQKMCNFHFVINLIGTFVQQRN